ncbi:MAG: universal stress protein [Anaerolineae bacterium]|nr:MAG: universal stress protein [Anaerolineae bacterium]
MRHGSPAEEILECVAEVGADLIVMSTHGRSGINRWVFGSVAGRLLHSAPIPILLIRPARQTWKCNGQIYAFARSGEYAARHRADPRL